MLEVVTVLGRSFTFKRRGTSANGRTGQPLSGDTLLQTPPRPNDQSPTRAKLRKVAQHLYHLSEIGIGLGHGFFNPNRRFQTTCGLDDETLANGLARRKSEVVTTEDGKSLDAHFFPAGRQTDSTILFSHGRSGHIDDYYPICILLQSKLKTPNILIYDYRHFGNSKGLMSTRLTAPLDSHAALKRLIEMGIPINKISLLGHSVGSAVSLELASHLLEEHGEKPNCLILASPYKSPRDAAETKYKKVPRWLAHPLVTMLINQDFLNPDQLIERIGDTKVEFIHGDNDSYFPLSHSETLHRKLQERGGNSHLTVVQNADHKDVFEHLGTEAFTRLRRLIN